MNRRRVYYKFKVPLCLQMLRSGSTYDSLDEGARMGEETVKR